MKTLDFLWGFVAPLPRHHPESRWNQQVAPVDRSKMKVEHFVAEELQPVHARSLLGLQLKSEITLTIPHLTPGQLALQHVCWAHCVHLLSFPPPGVPRTGHDIHPQ